MTASVLATIAGAFFVSGLGYAVATRDSGQGHATPAAKVTTVAAQSRSEPVLVDPVTEPAPEPVQFKNPFDRAEVFEFAPGTSEAEARDAVATTLIERARERLDSTTTLQASDSSRQDKATRTSMTRP